jgi:acyl-coenzyme A synthetase/AMP-(fatty) acid ligase
MAGVADCAVVGVPDRENGQLPKAYVQLRKAPGPPVVHPSASEVIEFVAARVAPYKKVRSTAVAPPTPTPVWVAARASAHGLWMERSVGY